MTKLDQLEKERQEAQAEVRNYGRSKDFNVGEYKRLLGKLQAARRAVKEFQAQIPTNTVYDSVQRCERRPARNQDR